MSDRWSRPLTVIAGAAVMANAAVILRLVWGHLNYVQIDHAGHIASAAAFARGEYHQFSDQAFLGYIHGLFYPPLQDALLGALAWISGDRYVVAYQLYLSVLVIAYLGAIVHLTLGFQRRLARAAVLCGLLFLLNIEKPDLLLYQGLSFVDLWLTGLSTQVLGGVFLLGLIREWLGPARPSRLGVWLGLCVISHLVVGFVALLLIAIGWIQDRRPGVVPAVLTALGMTAFFWIPFVLERGVLTTSNILLFKPLGFAGAAALGLALGIRNRKARTLFALALILVAPLIVGPWLSELGVPYPSFHYYRFAIIAVFLIVIGYGALLDSTDAPPRWRPWAVYAALAAICVLAISSFRLQRYSHDWPSLTASDVRVDDPAALELPAYGRFWVIGDARSVDFGIDATLATRDPEFRSTKGLYWESHRHNRLLSSWYATLLGTPVVLDYFHFWGYGCDVHACLVDQFIADYNVRGLIVDESVALPYVAPNLRQCYRKLLADRGTRSFELVRRGTVRDTGKTYGVFHVASRGTRSNDVLEPIASSDLVGFDPAQPVYYGEPMKAAYARCTADQPARTFIDQRDLAAAPTGVAKSPAPLSFTKQSSTEFSIAVDAPSPILFRIKLAHLPGVELEDERGNPLPLFEGMSGMIAYGHGKLTLRYRRPSGVTLGYGVSLLVALGTIARWILRRRRGNSPTSTSTTSAPPSPPIEQR